MGGGEQGSNPGFGSCPSKHLCLTLTWRTRTGVGGPEPQELGEVERQKHCGGPGTAGQARRAAALPVPARQRARVLQMLPGPPSSEPLPRRTPHTPWAARASRPGALEKGKTQAPRVVRGLRVSPRPRRSRAGCQRGTC